MTLHLILMRHAKSGWDDLELADHDRTLTPRGTADAATIGAWLRDAGHIPDTILSSDATRTGQTVHGVLSTLGAEPAVTYLAGLYHAGPDTILRQIAKQQAKTLMICGHNPGIGALAARLVITRPDHPRFGDYPTAATTVIRFADQSWSDIQQGSCIAFVTPHDLNA